MSEHQKILIGWLFRMLDVAKQRRERDVFRAFVMGVIVGLLATAMLAATAIVVTRMLSVL